MQIERLDEDGSPRTPRHGQCQLRVDDGPPVSANDTPNDNKNDGKTLSGKVKWEGGLHWQGVTIQPWSG